MRQIIESKGKPCCINMITVEDKQFLDNLEKQALKEQKAKAKAEAPPVEEEPQPVAEGEEGETQKKAEESEEEVDELTKLILEEEREEALLKQ